MSPDNNSECSISDNQIDDHVDMEIARCLKSSPRRSFFMYAGAGSGKTRSLINALHSLRLTAGEDMRLRRQQVAVITYTNAACEEILRRLDFDPLFQVSTIHSFIWGMINGFNTDIRLWLNESLQIEIQNLENLESKGRKNTQASLERLNDIRMKKERVDSLPCIRKFTYSPNTNKMSRDSLNHSEIIKMGAHFLSEKKLFQDLLICQYPVLFIDESQDTNSLLLDAFIKLQCTHQSKFTLGLFGDTMQRIYSEGNPNISECIPKDWATPEKLMNHRSSKRVITLINKVRSTVDGKKQNHRTEARPGFARLFIAGNNADRQQIELHVRKRMSEITSDHKWTDDSNVKILMLEHHMASVRLNFFDLFDSLSSIRSLRTQLIEGSLPMLNFFSDIVFPLVEAQINNSDYKVATIAKKFSPLLNKEAISVEYDNQQDRLQQVLVAVNSLMDLFTDKSDPSFLDVIKTISNSKLFDIPEILKPFLEKSSEELTYLNDNDSDKDDSSDYYNNLARFLNSRFHQIKPYYDYVNSKSQFDTHQGVKGLEFERVLVIIDGFQSRGFMFDYDKFFGVKQKSDSDRKNEKDQKETTIDRTRRLFYVTCSRAIDSLAVVIYTSEPQALIESVTKEEFFESDEVVIL